jgi:hypothetical protein
LCVSKNSRRWPQCFYTTGDIKQNIITACNGGEIDSGGECVAFGEITYFKLCETGFQCFL